MILFERYAHMKYKLGNRHFWNRDIRNKQAEQKYIQYIQNQEKEDMISSQISRVEYYALFEKWLKSNKEKRDIPKKK